SRWLRSRGATGWYTIPKASFRATPKFSARASIFPNPRDLKRSAPAGQACSPCSFDVLYLLPQFFDLGFNFEREPGDSERFTLDPGCFRQQRVRFAVHLLQEKIELLSHLAGAVQKFSELLEMAAQAV